MRTTPSGHTFRIVLPTEEQLRLELIREQRLLEEQSAAPTGQLKKRKKLKRTK